MRPSSFFGAPKFLFLNKFKFQKPKKPNLLPTAQTLRSPMFSRVVMMGRRPGLAATSRAFQSSVPRSCGKPAAAPPPPPKTARQQRKVERKQARQEAAAEQASREGEAGGGGGGGGGGMGLFLVGCTVIGG